MADVADLASTETDTLLQLAQWRARSAARLHAAGRCHNCEEILTRTGQLFCDVYCEEDYRRHERAAAFRRR